MCLTDDLEVHVLELPKLRNNLKIDRRLLGWLEFFEEEEEGKNMDTVIEKNPKLTRAEELFKRFTENEELNRYEAKVKYERDLRYWAECYAEKKYNEAREEGEHKKAVETAKKFLSMGLSVEQVADGTGLSIEEIEKL